MKTIKFKDYDCYLVQQKYRNSGRVALQLIDSYDGSPVAMATVNIHYIELAPGEVIVKDWSENEGMLEALVNAGIVEDTGRVVRTGFVDANICKLLV
jgi:Rieske Fe-S protein